jgi:hypothetical protein
VFCGTCLDEYVVLDGMPHEAEARKSHDGNEGDRKERNPSATLKSEPIHCLKTVICKSDMVWFRGCVGVVECLYPSVASR